MKALVRHPVSRRFLRFVLVGIVNTGIGYALFAGFVLAGLAPQPALALAFVLGVLWNYVATARFVFEVSGYRRLPAYAACYLAVYGGNAWALAKLLATGLPPLAAQALLTPVAAVLTFVMVSVALTGRIGGAPQVDAAARAETTCRDCR